MSVPLVVLHTSQIGLSLLVLNFSRSVIPKLQQYEDKSKKAAEYSQAAADQLTKTRATQAAGVVAGTFSLISSIALTYHDSGADLLGLLSQVWFSVANTGFCFFAFLIINDFWSDKAKLPLAKDYNDAITETNQMGKYLLGLSMNWGVSMLLTVIMRGGT